MLSKFRINKLLSTNRSICNINKTIKSVKLKQSTRTHSQSYQKLRDKYCSKFTCYNQFIRCYGLHQQGKLSIVSKFQFSTTENKEKENIVKDDINENQNPSEIVNISYNIFRNINKDNSESEIKVSDESILEFTKKDKELEKRVKGIELPEAKVEEVDEDLELEKTERGRIVRERRVFLAEYNHYIYEQKWGAFMMVTGICLFVLGTWSLMVPLYKVVCEKFGFSTKSHKSDYNIDVTTSDVFK